MIKKKLKRKRNLPRKPLAEHLEELRVRLLWAILALLIGAVVGYIFRVPVLSYLLQPLHQPVYYSSPTGGFNFIFKICLFFGVLTSLPVFVFQLLQFITPILPESLQKVLGWYVVLSVILLVTGMSCAYFINLPVMLHFFNQFSSKDVHALISTDSYLSFILNDLLGFALIFQLPLFLLLFNHIRRIRVAWLFKQEKYIIVLGFLLGAILTPDPLNQTIMALPIILLYQFSILLIFLVNRRK